MAFRKKPDQQKILLLILKPQKVKAKSHKQQNSE
jgi:hypothetical protein